MLAAVDGEGLVEIVWVSALAGLGVTVTFSLVVLGSGRAAAARREGRVGEARVFAVLAGVALLVFAAGVVTGVNIMLAKD